MEKLKEKCIAEIKAYKPGIQNLEFKGLKDENFPYFEGTYDGKPCKFILLENFRLKEIINTGYRYICTINI